MITERTLTQLAGRTGSAERAQELGHLGYMQWLGGLPGHASYEEEAVRACLMAARFGPAEKAIAVFRGLLLASIEAPATPLSLRLPNPRRRGGARERRLSN